MNHGDAASAAQGDPLVSDELVPDARLALPLEEPGSGVIRVAFLIAPGAELIDFAGPWGVFEYVTVGDGQRKPFELYTVAAGSGPVRVSGGMTIVPGYDLGSAPGPDVIVVPAMGPEGPAPEALEWLRRAHERAAVTMSVCNGAFVLAEAGLLDGKSATAHHVGYGYFRAMFPQVNVLRGRRFVEDGKIATAGGLTSGTDLALRVVERYYGRDVARQTAVMLEYQGTGWMRPGSNSEFTEPRVGTPGRPVCPVCEMDVPKDAPHTREHDGVTWYFCGTWCSEQFDKAPQLFAAGQ